MIVSERGLLKIMPQFRNAIMMRFFLSLSVLNRCSEITCGANEICETETTGPKCICKSGFAGDSSCTGKEGTVFARCPTSPLKIVCATFLMFVVSY